MNEADIKIIELIIELALKEDIRTGDVTTDNIVEAGKIAKAHMIAKEDGVIAGLPIAEIIFKKLDDSIEWNPLIREGEKVEKGKAIVQFEGSLRAILTGERTALNFLQRMSGIATETSKYVKVLEGYKTKLLDTRKTVPGLRMLDKYAVKMGGGTNHRVGLFDMVMIKDNHIEAAGGITNAVRKVKEGLKEKIQIEVETKNLAEVEIAITSEVDIIMLDNMSIGMMAEAVKLINGRAKVEASGNMTLDRLVQVAETGVDFISVGALTHSVKGLDISQYIEVK